MRLVSRGFLMMLQFCPLMACAADGSKSSFFGDIISFVVSVFVFGFLIDLVIKKR